MINKMKFNKLKERFSKEVPFFTYSEMKKLKEHKKWSDNICIYTFGTSKINYDYAFNSVDSGVVILKYKNMKKLEIADLGLELKYRNKHYGEAIVKIIHETFPNCEIIVNDCSEGFWKAMWKKYPRINLN